MRLMLDTIVALLLVGLLGGLLWLQRQEQMQQHHIEQVQHALRALESQALYRAAVGDAQATPVGFADRLLPEWFDRLPHNSLVDPKEVPWLDATEDATRDHVNPKHIVADSHHAAFWYNPHRGIIRARVPMQFTWDETVALYNAVNGTGLRVEQIDWVGALTCGTQVTTVDEPMGDPVLRDFGVKTQ